jgi:hypothetical protein
VAKFIVYETIHLQGGEEYVHERPDLPALESSLITILAGQVNVYESGSQDPCPIEGRKPVRLRFPIRFSAETYAIVLAEYSTPDFSTANAPLSDGFERLAR